MGKAELLFLLFFSTIYTLQITINSNEPSQVENYIFNTFSEGADFIISESKFKFNFATNTKNDKIISFESKDMEIT